MKYSRWYMSVENRRAQKVKTWDLLFVCEGGLCLGEEDERRSGLGVYWDGCGLRQVRYSMYCKGENDPPTSQNRVPGYVHTDYSWSSCRAHLALSTNCTCGNASLVSLLGDV